MYTLCRENLQEFPPLLFKGKEQSELLNYRIYGDTVDGESVGGRTANLIQGSIKNANIGNNGKINTSNEYFLVYAPVVTGESYTISNNNGTNVYAFYNAVPSAETATSYDSSRQIFSTSTITFVSPITGYIAVRLANTAQDIMINPGSTALPYEPYGYKVPVKVEGKNLFNNIWEQGNIRADNGQKEASNMMICSDYFPVEYDKTYSISRTISEGYNNVRGYDASKNYIGGGTTVCSVTNPFANADTKKGIIKITNSLVAFVKFNHYSNNLNMKYMIVEGDYTNTPIPPYEPYREPVITNLYLPEPIKMVGDEAEYIDYAEQKQHFADGTSVDVTLPALPVLPGTNTMSIDTTVQPSRIDIKGRIKTLT